eukprot:463036-Pleurochrysis_carterae.AAC.1
MPPRLLRLRAACLCAARGSTERDAHVESRSGQPAPPAPPLRVPLSVASACSEYCVASILLAPTLLCAFAGSAITFDDFDMDDDARGLNSEAPSRGAHNTLVADASLLTHFE